MKTSDDPLQDLRIHDVDGRVSNRILRQARALDRQRARRLTHPRSAWISFWYYRAVEPAALVGLGLWYLIWAVQGTLAVFQ